MNFLYKLYFWIPNFSFLGFFGKVMNKLMYKILKFIFDLFIPYYLRKTIKKTNAQSVKNNSEVKYIVSLTSFPARINDIWICIETVLRQTVKPDHIILWLANEQFPSREIPENLSKLQNRGLTIKFCEDLKSHKKYFFAMQEYPYANIITLDDDVYYPNNTLEKLINLHLKFPNAISANRVHKMTFENNEILTYSKWKHNHKKIGTPSHLLVQTGIAGVLYPPKSLDEILFDKNQIKELCLNADDLWLKFTGFLRGTKVVTNTSFNKDFITIGNTHQFSLIKNNGQLGGNDVQLNNILSFFKLKSKDFLEL